MKIAPLPVNERARLGVLRSFDILDTDQDEELDELVQLASNICQTPIAALSLVDEHRQWFKAITGLDAKETSREVAFCAHTILQDDVMVVSDAHQDERFFDNPLVTSAPFIRFYAGVPLAAAGGECLGTLCVIDRVQRTLDPAQLNAIRILADSIMVHLNLRLHQIQLRQHVEDSQNCNSQLQLQNERNQAIIQNASDGIHILDTSGNLVEASDSFCAMLGYNREELIGKNVAQWDVQFAPSELASLIAKQFQDKSRSLFETRHRRKDGSIFDVEVSGLQLDLEGKSALFYSSRDITERKHRDDTLKLHLKRAQAMLGLPFASEHMDETAFMQHGQEWAENLTGSQIAFIHFVNEDQETIELVTWSRRTIEHYCHATFEKPYPVSKAGIWADALRKKQAVMFNDYTSYPDKHGLPEGYSELKRLISVPVIENGKVVMLTGVGNKATDYTELDIETVQLISNDIWQIVQRKRAEDKLRISAIAFESHEGMIITDDRTRIQSVNHAFTDITGYSEEEVIGKKPSILSSGRQDASFYAAMWESIRDTGGWQGEIWNKRKNGEFYPELLMINAVKDKNGKVTHYVGALIDTTEREKNLEQLRLSSVDLEVAHAQVEEERAFLAQRVLQRTVQLQLANHAKDSFLATMSHEIRTPLSGLLGIMELLTLSHLDAKQQEMLKVARNSGKSLLRIVNDILDWSKIEAGKLLLAPNVASISDMLNDVANTYTQIASEKDIIIKVDLDPELSSAHIFDSLRISQILNNFTSNAIKFSEHGIIEIRAENVAQHTGREEIRFSVKDSGIGISQAQQSRLFQDYTQASEDTARMYGGTGLGLAICRRLAEMMDGRLGVESIPESGSTFSLTVALPVASLAAQRELQQNRNRIAGGSDIAELTSLDTLDRQLKILIVDDHPVNRMLLKQQLELLGIDVVAAESGTPALALLQNGHFDLIITDCHMPEMDGYDLTRRIREQEQQAGAKRIPIIAWTANVLAEEEAHSQAAGMDDLLTKPTELPELKAKLLKWLPKISGSSTGKHPVDAPNQVVTEVAINLSVLKSFVLSRPAQIEMLRAFNEQNRSDIVNLNAILKDGDLMAVAQAAHRIKGASRMVGAKELEKISTAIELAAKQGDMQGARTAAITLDAAMARIKDEVERFVKG